MMNHRSSRRGFMNLTGAGIAALVGGAWPGTAAANEGRDADLVVFNAKVYTVDSRAPKVEAFAVKAGRFIAVGNTSKMKALIGDGTQTFDAKQMAVTPGFIDCHNHAPGDVLLYEVIVGNPYVVEFVTIDSIVEKLRSKAAQTPPGMWIDGYFLAIKGSITSGKLADFVVLSDNLFTVDKQKIKDLQIVRTVVGGNTVYQI